MGYENNAICKYCGKPLLGDWAFMKGHQGNVKIYRDSFWKELIRQIGRASCRERV